MSYNDSYGHEPRRSSRRASREPAGPAKIQGSTAAAILVLVAIVGFGIGALIGNSGGDGDETDGTTGADPDGAAADTPDEQGSDPDDAASQGPTDGDDGTGASVAVTLEMDDEAEAGEELEYTVSTEPEQPGLVLGMERRMPDGEWTPFGQEQVTAELDDDGEDEGHVVTGRVGESEWRLVGEIDGQRVESNVVTATITEEEDNSGPGNGNGNGNGNDEDRSGSNSGDG